MQKSCCRSNCLSYWAPQELQSQLRETESLKKGEKNGTASWEPRGHFVDDDGTINDIFETFCEHHRTPQGPPKPRAKKNQATPTQATQPVATRKRTINEVQSPQQSKKKRGRPPKQAPT
eukprot:TRINITY_DN963_c0_g1_i1.p1 TRINITY_DN963_c0_g1~~TRINITY_DN963_c0_g1_i1.p1  ORF type:complete len:119 (-),score=27.88 TRINITY_DN963_c0_g1_i1:96-452(-)